MASSPFSQLHDLAREDASLRLALAAAMDSSELKAIASQRGILLSDSEAQQWLADATQSGASLTPEELEAITDGLSLTDEELDSIAAGQLPGGEALLGYAGEA